MSELTNFLDNWYPTRLADRLLIIADIEKMWEEFKPYTDATCLKEFTSGEENKFQERYWEVFLGSCFMRQGLKLSPPPKTTGGPDFRIEHNGRVIWIEAITASPGIQNNQVPDISPSHGIASRVPSEEILLRYTAAIKEKYEKYSERYLNKIIKPGEVFIIAVNYYKYSPLYVSGKSTYPAILEAVYPMGPQQIHKDGSQSISYRDKIINANQAKIATNLFIDPQYSGITAVLFANQNEFYRSNYPTMPIIMAHNKLATNPLRPSPIKVDCEYWIEDIPNERYGVCQSPLACV